MAEGGQAAPKAATDPLIGRIIADRFKILALIARGGMGKVYRAEQAPLGRSCAVKILNPSYAGEQDPEFHKRFFLEASVASRLKHPNTVTIFDYGRTDDDIYYMAMELLEGVTLHRAIREAGSFPEDRVSHIARQICRALREAHSLGVIHRDLKPANIFLVDHGDESDFVKVLDFGLVKSVVDTKPEDQLTQTGLFMGSPKYMAPEQIRGDKVDARTDIYSLGIMMYEMLTGKVPFDRPNSLNILMAQVNEDAVPLSMMNPEAQVSVGLQDLIARCMSKDPDGRAASMNDVLAELKSLGTAFSVTGTGEYESMSSGLHPRSASASDSLPMVAAERQELRSSRPPASAIAHPPSDPPISLVVEGSGAARVPSQRPDGRAASEHPTSLASAPPKAESSPPPAAPASVSDTVLAPAIDATQPEPRKGRTGLWVGVIMAAVAAAALVYVGRAGTADDPSRSAAAEARPAAPAPVAAPTPSVVAVASVPATRPPAAMSSHLVTDPPGAIVKEDGKEICAATPCDHDFGADVTSEHKLLFYRPGFRLESRAIHAGDTPISVRLTAARAWSAPVAQPKPAEPSTAPSGFKEIPY